MRASTHAAVGNSRQKHKQPDAVNPDTSSAATIIELVGGTDSSALRAKRRKTAKQAQQLVIKEVKIAEPVCSRNAAAAANASSDGAHANQCISAQELTLRPTPAVKHAAGVQRGSKSNCSISAANDS